MLAYFLGWLILLFQPRWVFLFAFTAAIIALSSPALFVATDRESFVVVLIGVFLAGAMFMAVGGPIVAIRKWLKSRSEKSGGKEIDAELARIRAEAAARGAQQQAPPQG